MQPSIGAVELSYRSDTYVPEFWSIFPPDDIAHRNEAIVAKLENDWIVSLAGIERIDTFDTGLTLFFCSILSELLVLSFVQIQIEGVKESRGSVRDKKYARYRSRGGGGTIVARTVSSLRSVFIRR